MRIKVILFLLPLMIIASCSDAPLLVEKQTLDQNSIANCANKPCPQVEVDYITYGGEDEIVAPINAKIKQFAIASLYLGNPESAPTANTIQEAIAEFIKDYWRDTSEFPDTNEYEAEVTVEETFRSATLASVALTQYKYTGGAHGNGGVGYVNFDIETGAIITNKDLIKDLKSLEKFAESKLRSDNGLSELDNINQNRFWFENDKFYLSDNIGFEKGKMVIHYNPYEIASYADGIIDIELALKDVAPFLNYCISCKE